MEAIAVLFGVLLFLGAPLTGLILAILALRRIRTLETRLLDLESDLLALKGQPAPARVRPALAHPPLPVQPGVAEPRPTTPTDAPSEGSPTDLAGPMQAAEPTPAPTPESASVVPSPSTPPNVPQHGDETLWPDGPPPPPPRPGATPRPGAAPRPTPPVGRPIRPPAERVPPTPPKPPVTVEWLITRLAAGLGGFSVLLGVLFALSAAIDKGWVGPAMRVSGALVGGTVLVIWGSVMRSRKLSWSGSGLLGAGLGVLYGALFASVSLYHILPQTVGFAALIALTTLGMVMADRLRDPAGAALTLVGGLLTPVMLSTGENNALGLYSYLFMLSGGMAFVAIRRDWWPLLIAATGGSLLLFLGWTSRYHQADQLPAAVLALAALSIPPLVAGLRGSQGTATGQLMRGAAGALLIALTLSALPWVLPIDPLFVDPRTGESLWRPMGTAPYWALATVILLPLPLWLIIRQTGRSSTPNPKSVPADTDAALLGGVFFLGVSALLAGAFALGHLESPSIHPALPAAGLLLPVLTVTLLIRAGARGPASLSPLLSGVTSALLFGLSDPPDAGFAALAILIPPTLAFGLERLAGQRPAVPAGLIGTTIAGFAALRVQDEVEPLPLLGALGLAFALLALGSLPRGREKGQPFPAIHHASAALAGPALFYPLWQLWDLHWGDAALGALPLLLAMGALIGALAQLRIHGAHRGSGILALFVATALAGITAAIPLQLHDGWLTVAWALETVALAALTRRLTHPMLGLATVGLGLTVAVRLVFNPWALEYGDTSGLPILNWTLWTWGVPFLSLLASARLLGPEGRPGGVGKIGRAALIFAAIAVGFALVNVQVSHAFQTGGPIALSGQGLLQGMVRSLAWAAYGILVLLSGIRGDSRALRLVGFALVMLAAGKVFVVDLWDLSGFVRVGSVMGLGATLLLAAFLFERIVLRSKPKEANDGQ